MKNFKNKKMTRITIMNLEDKIMFHVLRKGKSRCKSILKQPKIFYIDSNSIKESMYDYLDCINILQDDKIARRWFIKASKNLMLGNNKVSDYLLLTGKINFKKAEQDDNIKK